MQNRLRRALILGGLASMLLGSGLFALTSDSVSSTGNSVASATYTPTAHDIRIARIPASSPSGACSTASFVSNANQTAAISNGAANIESATPVAHHQADDFCLKNVGSAAGQLVVSFANMTETELGACESSETAAGDTTCGAGATGELASLMLAGFAPADGGCTGGQATFTSLPTSPLQMSASFAPGATCRLHVYTQHKGSSLTDAQKLVAQTDQVQWDIVFTLKD